MTLLVSYPPASSSHPDHRGGEVRIWNIGVQDQSSPTNKDNGEPTHLVVVVHPSPSFLLSQKHSVTLKRPQGPCRLCACRARHGRVYTAMSPLIVSKLRVLSFPCMIKSDRTQIQVETRDGHPDADKPCMGPPCTLR